MTNWHDPDLAGRSPHEGNPFDNADFYVRLGLHVFPCYTAKGRACSCGDLACTDIAKHPLTPHGLLDATTEAAAIRRWRKRWPDANIAMATGERSGVDVFDIDTKHNGLRALAELEERHGPLPSTWCTRTGSGGLHVFFRHWPRLRNSVGRIASGLDVRAGGGYVILPPSRHASGNRYEWIDPPGEVPLAAWPDWLAALALPPDPQPLTSAPIDLDRTYPVPAGLRRFAEAGAVEGQRNSSAFWLACRLIQECGETTEARHCLDRFGRSCQPPLTQREIDKIWHSATQRQCFAPHSRAQNLAPLTRPVGIALQPLIRPMGRPLEVTP